VTGNTLWSGARQPPGVLLGALITVLILTGCHGPSGCFLCGPYADSLGGTLSGLVGSRLRLQNNSSPGSQLNGPGANGTNVVFATALFSSGYNVTVVTQPTNPSRSSWLVRASQPLSGENTPWRRALT
jgi:hypothetical protein